MAKRLDAASAARVVRATQVVTEALESIEGLTPSERTQALVSLAAFHSVGQVIEKMNVRLRRKKDGEPEAAESKSDPEKTPRTI